MYGRITTYVCMYVSIAGVKSIFGYERVVHYRGMYSVVNLSLEQRGVMWMNCLYMPNKPA